MSTTVKVKDLTDLGVITDGDKLVGERVDGTTSRITYSDIGSTARTTVGTLTTGVWNATTIAPGYGGTGIASYTTNSMVYATGATTLAQLTAVANAVLSYNGSGVPSASTTLPSGLTIPGYQATLTPAALTEVDDTNVTLTLGGTPATALLQATSLTLGWTGTLSPARGGTGVNNGTSTITLGGNLTTSGAFNSTFTMTGGTSVTLPTSGTLATTSQLPTPAALTKTDDTNVTLTLGGTPATALLQASSLTLGWTGQLGLTRGGTAASLTASNGGIVYSTASALAVLSGNATASKMLLSGASTTPTWSTSTIPTSAGATANKVLLSDGTNYVLSTPTFPNASATSGKIIKSDGTNWIASTETYAVPGTAGNLLRSDGTNWTAAKATLTTDVTGVLPVANGGTNGATTDAAKISLAVITSATGSEILPAGTTAQRDGSPATGYFRFNTTTTAFEGYNGTSWSSLGSGGGDFVLISSATASSSATIDFTSISNTVYDSYRLVIRDFLPATNGVNLWLRTSAAGVFRSTADYSHQSLRWTTSALGYDGSTAAASAIILDAAADPMANTTSGSWIVDFFNCSNTTKSKRCVTQGYYYGTTDLGIVGSGISAPTTAVDGFRLLMSSGNIASGKVYLYGVKA